MSCRFNNFCTISTLDYLPYVLTLNHSLRINGNSKLFVLLLDNITVNKKYDGVKFICINELNRLDQIEKYRREGDTDEFRWSLKPIWMKFLFTNYPIDKLIYVDNDIMFFDDYSFLFEDLENNQILLTPHWRNIYPSEDCHNFDLLFKHGLFNAGFIGVNKKAILFLDWFCEVVSHRMTRENGYYDDQKFLDVVPLYFEGVKVLEHKGCNVSEWNESYLKREQRKDRLFIDGDPLIFIHFVQYYKSILFNLKRDQLIIPYYEKWKDNLTRNGLKSTESRINENAKKLKSRSKLKILSNKSHSLLAKVKKFVTCSR